MQPQIAELLIDAATLLVVGMVTVFLFLTLLIVAIKAIARFSNWLPEAATPDVVSSPSRSSVNQHSHEGGTLSGAKLAAISAAIHKYRSTK